MFRLAYQLLNLDSRLVHIYRLRTTEGSSELLQYILKYPVDFLVPVCSLNDYNPLQPNLLNTTYITVLWELRAPHQSPRASASSPSFPCACTSLVRSPPPAALDYDGILNVRSSNSERQTHGATPISLQLCTQSHITNPILLPIDLRWIRDVEGLSWLWLAMSKKCCVVPHLV